MIFAASIAEPPPKAMMVSGSNLRMAAAPFCAESSEGSGSTSENTVQVMFISLSLSVIGLV